MRLEIIGKSEYRGERQMMRSSGVYGEQSKQPTLNANGISTVFNGARIAAGAIRVDMPSLLKKTSNNS
jgi:hypothetical protein